MNILEAEGLTKYYGLNMGIEDFNLSIEKGAFFGFIGPNGAGKSTAIRTLLGLIHPTSGDARIFGLDFRKERNKILSRIGYVPSEVMLYDSLTGEDHLRYSARFYGEVDEGRMMEMAEWLDFDMKRPVEDLSFGNRKKLGIMLALMHRPELLIMDEPTSGLDPLMQSRFFEWLKRENEEGVTVFFSSHTLSEVQRHCREVAIIREGRVLEIADIDSLRAKQLKKVSVQFKHARELAGFRGIDGVYRFVADENEAVFDFDGEYCDLFAFLANLPVSSFTMEEPTLEEIFMHYYRAGER